MSISVLTPEAGNYFLRMMSELLRGAAYGRPPSFREAERFCNGAFLAEIERDETASLIYPFVKNHPAIPGQTIRRIRREYERALMHRDLALQTLETLKDGLCATGRVVLIQGLAALEHLYPEPWARAMGDIDLYLPDGNDTAVHALLRERGFEPCGGYGQVWARRGIVIDLHVDFWGADRIAARALLTQGVPVDLVPSRTMPGYLVPAASCASFHAAFHALKHGFARKRWLFDLLMYFRAGHLRVAPGCPHSFIVPIALDRLAASGLITTEERADVDAPLPGTRRRMLDRVLRNGDRVGRGELALALACPTWGATVRYLMGSFFPPRQTLNEMYGARSFPGLYARRIVSLFRKAAA
ncbi:MAG: nucleotidyltransferase family protein [Chitinispirillaceae bacterium]|nr:nucleotidyltransferase family protein [Chitinispirillaceae bacterium]